MAKYKITFKKSVSKDRRNIPASDVKRILKKIDSLAENPQAKAVLSFQPKSVTEFGRGFIALFMKFVMKYLFSLSKSGAQVSSAQRQLTSKSRAEHLQAL